MRLHTNVVLAAPCHLQLLGWDTWTCSALLVGVTPFLARVIPFPLGHLLLNVCHSLFDVCHHIPSKCHLFLARVTLFPVCVPTPSWCVSPRSQCVTPFWHTHIFPSICHPFPACYPIFSMSPPFPGWITLLPVCVPTGGASRAVVGHTAAHGVPSPWQSHMEKTHCHPFTSMAQTVLAYQQQKSRWSSIY